MPIYRHSYTTDYFLASGNSLMPVLREAEAPRDASFSPDGKLIAYSDRNDLYVYDTAGKRTRRITDDGAWNSVINGTTDWVYEEEFGFTRAYAFSPDSRRIAYLRFDESEVPLMEMMRFDGKLYNQAYSFKYPKAGERNSTVEVWVCDLATGTREALYDYQKDSCERYCFFGKIHYLCLIFTDKGMIFPRELQYKMHC